MQQIGINRTTGSFGSIQITPYASNAFPLNNFPPAIVAALVITVATLHISQLFFHNGEDFFFAEFCQLFGYRYR